MYVPQRHKRSPIKGNLVRSSPPLRLSSSFLSA